MRRDNILAIPLAPSQVEVADLRHVVTPHAQLTPPDANSQGARWPDHIDEGRFMQFLQGYGSVDRLDNARLEALPDLMIETMIAEVVLPIAATGSFGHLSGLDFLQMILRKSYWLNEHRQILVKTIHAACSRQSPQPQDQSAQAMKSAS